MSSSETPIARIDELLIDEALWGLQGGELDELGHLSRAEPVDARRRTGYELTAAKASLAFLRNRLETPPGRLVGRLESLAVHTLMERRGLRLVDIERSLVGPPSGEEPVGASGPISSATLPPPGPRPWSAHVVAAAALVLAAFLLWTQQASELDNRRLVTRVQTAEDLLRMQWSGDLGEVLWSPELQQGVMKFRGLAKNDPSRARYQLWIFDETRSSATPVDGGLFDVEEDGEVTVPFSGKLRVNKAAAFAVTVEQPEGVVVSEREQIAAATF